MSARTSVVDKLTAFASGLGVVLGLHLVDGWWLNAGRDVLRTSLLLFALSAIAAVWRESRTSRESARSGASEEGTTTLRDRALALWLGAVSGSVISLFLVGPGTIWPIVLAAAALVAASAILLGTLLGAGLKRLWRPLR